MGYERKEKENSEEVERDTDQRRREGRMDGQRRTTRRGKRRTGQERMEGGWRGKSDERVERAPFHDRPWLSKSINL